MDERHQARMKRGLKNEKNWDKLNEMRWNPESQDQQAESTRVARSPSPGFLITRWMAE